MATRKKTPSKPQSTTLRHLWLAGLGAVAIARRESLNAVNDAATRFEALKQQAGKVALQSQAIVLGGIANVREQSEARAGQFSADVESRLAPVLVKLGLKARPVAKRGRKTTTKKTAAKRMPARSPRKPRGAAAKAASKRVRG